MQKTIRIMIKTSINSLFITLLISFLFSCNNSDNNNSNNKLSEEKKIHIPKVAYGINIDTLDIISGKIKKNEFLADLLLKYNVNYGDIDFIARNTKDTFDVRKIVAGNNYSIISTTDSVPKTLYFAYEISPSKYVLYNFGDSIIAIKGEKQITTITDTTSGKITSSLWNAMVSNGTDANLSNDLSETYAWTIDFFGLQKNDTYKVIYTKQYVDSTYIGLDKIIASVFYHGGDSLFAFYFEQNGKGDYFDEKGNSLQRTFLKAPLRFTRISSRFSNSRLHPVLKIRRPHHGVDYAAPTGTPVFAVGDGTVIKKGYQKRGGGNYIKIKHNGTYSTTYMHLKGFAKGVKVGNHVTQGELVGYVGSTGLATGPHLDFRFYKNGKPVDPLKVKSPPSLPIDTAYQTSFDSVVAVYLDALKK